VDHKAFQVLAVFKKYVEVIFHWFELLNLIFFPTHFSILLASGIVN